MGSRILPLLCSQRLYKPFKRCSAGLDRRVKGPGHAFYRTRLRHNRNVRRALYIAAYEYQRSRSGGLPCLSQTAEACGVHGCHRIAASGNYRNSGSKACSIGRLFGYKSNNLIHQLWLWKHIIQVHADHVADLIGPIHGIDIQTLCP